MEAHTVFACNINETDSIKPICNRFEETNKLYFCTGTANVGKTAMAIKLAHTLFTKATQKFKPLVISFDNTVKYWQETSNYANDILFKYPFTNKEEVSWQDVIENVEAEMLQASANFIVLDGINYYAFKWDVNDIKMMLSFLIKVIQEKQTNIFITYRSQKGFFLYKDLGLEENNLIELWHLERPEYFEKEFGETKLLIN